MTKLATIVFLHLLTEIGFTNCYAQQTVLPVDKVIKLIPDKISQFQLSADPQGKLMELGDIKYSMAEKIFSGSRQRSVKVLLFDYKEAPIMYRQATRKFSTNTTIESDTLISRSVLMTDCTGWETFNVLRKSSQVLLGVCDRFFLSIEGTNMELSELKKFVSEFKFENFPK